MTARADFRLEVALRPSLPHTRSETNLATARVGDLVNLEFDLLAKYVERMLVPHLPRPT